MEYYQQLQRYFTSLGYSPAAVQQYSQVAYMQAMQQAQQTVSPQQDLIRQFMSLTDGQKMQFAQTWLLRNPQYFKKEPPPPEKKPETEDKKNDKEKTDETKDKDKKETEEKQKKFPVISGTGSISGNSFKSGDDESYQLKVASGGVYNLLSDKGLGINGRYGAGSDANSVVLRETAISFGGSIITFDSKGKLEIDGKDYRANRNDLDGAIERKGGRYVLSAGDYEITLSANESSGVRLSISGTDIKKDGVAPEGLWGVTFDGEEDKRRDIVEKIKVKDYRISSLKNFSFREHNNIAGADTKTGDKKKSVSEEEENLSAWQDSNPTMATALGRIGGGTFQFFGLDMADTKDDASWNMTRLNSSSIYNLFSDKEIQVGAKFSTTGTGALNYPREFGFFADGKIIKVNRASTADGKLSVTVDGTTLGAGSSSGKATMNADQTELTVSTSVDGESWAFKVKADTLNPEGLEMNISGTGLGRNDVRTSGLWGAFIGSGFVGDAGSNDTNGAGFIRDSEGARTWFDYDDMSSALAGYELSGYDTTDEGYSVYEGY